MTQQLSVCACVVKLTAHAHTWVPVVRRDLKAVCMSRPLLTTVLAAVVVVVADVYSVTDSLFDVLDNTHKDESFCGM